MPMQQSIRVRGTRDVNEDNEVQSISRWRTMTSQTVTYIMKMMRDDNSDKEQRKTRKVGDDENASYVTQR